MTQVDDRWLPPGTAPHPLLALVSELNDQAARALAGLEVAVLPTEEKAALLVGLTRLRQTTELLCGRALAAADDVADKPGARNAVAWLTHTTRTDPAALRRAHWLAERLAAWPLVDAAVEVGTVNTDQARVILKALDALLHPAVELGPEREQILEQAQLTLIGEAPRLTPHELAQLGARILEIVAPEIGEDEDARRLAREEAKAQASTHLHLYPLGNGLTRLEGHLPDADAARLRLYLDAYTNPRRPCTCGADDDPAADAFAHAPGCPGHASSPSCRSAGDVRDSAQRRGAALCQLLQSLHSADLPAHGGDATTLVITMTLDALRHDLGLGQLEDGTTVTAHQARRLACTAGLIPAVLGSESEPLDLGRSTRLFTPAQRRALALQYQHCQAHGCTIPARWCDAHHETWWSAGGTTDLANASLLCSYHHHRVHDPAYHHTRDADGLWTFTRLRN